MYGVVIEAMPISHLLGRNVRSPVPQSVLLLPPRRRLPPPVSPPRPKSRKVREVSRRYGGLRYGVLETDSRQRLLPMAGARLPGILVTRRVQRYDSLQ